MPDEKIVAFARSNAAQNGSSVLITHDPSEAIAQADVVYGDVWASMGQESEQKQREAVFASYQVNQRAVCKSQKGRHLYALPAGAPR